MICTPRPAVVALPCSTPCAVTAASLDSFLRQGLKQHPARDCMKELADTSFKLLSMTWRPTI